MTLTTTDNYDLQVIKAIIEDSFLYTLTLFKNDGADHVAKKYRYVCKTMDYAAFDAVCDWLTQQAGESYDTTSMTTAHNTKWAYMKTHEEVFGNVIPLYLIFIDNDALLTWFILKWQPISKL